MNNEPVDYPPLKAGGIIENNKPIAWIAYDEFGDFMLEATPEGDYPWQPLYTHPAKTIWCACGDGITPDSGAVCGNCATTHSAKEHFEDEPQAEKLHEILQSNTHPVKTQLNLVNVVKNHIKDLQNCVKLFRSAEMDNTANEMEVAIKELEDAINFHPAKTLTDEEIAQTIDKFWNRGIDGHDKDWLFRMSNFANAILKKASEK